MWGYFRHTAVNVSHSNSCMVSPITLKIRQNCFFRHQVQFTLLQALAVKEEKYQFEATNLKIPLFFLFFHASLYFFFSLPFTLLLSHVPLFLKHIIFGLPQMHIYISLSLYIYISTHVSAIVCHSWLFLLLSKEDNTMQWKRAHKGTMLCCRLYDFLSDWDGLQMHVYSWCEESVEDQWRRPIYLNCFQTHSACSQSSWTLTSIVRVTGTELRGKLDVYIFRRLLLGKQLLKPFRIHTDFFLLWISVTQVLLKRRLKMNQRNRFSSQCQSNIAYSITDLKVWNV